MEDITQKKQYKPKFVKKKESNFPFSNVNGQWFLDAPIKTKDYVKNKSGFELNPSGKVSKIHSFGGNVYTFGAVVDSEGKAQFKKIQDAINAGKSILFLRNGTHDLSEISALSANLTIIGEDRDNTILDFGSSNYLNVSFQKIHIENCKFQNANDYYLKSIGSNSIIDNCYFDTNATGHIYNNGKYFCIIQRCFFNDAPYGIYNTGPYLRVLSNHFAMGNTDTNIYSSGFILVESGNVFNNVAIGVHLTSNGGIVANNIFNAIKNKAIYAETKSAGFISKIIGNSIFGVGGSDYGIYLKSDYSLASGNLIDGEGNCIVVEGDNNRILGNPYLRATEAIRKSITVASGSDNCVKNNDIQSGFTDNGTDTEVGSNY